MKSENLKILKKDSVVYITFPKLSKTGIVNHLFSTRHGGESSGQYKSMNLSFLNGDERLNVLKNYGILCDITGTNIKNLVLSRQTHTDNIKIVTEKDRGTGIFKKSFQDVDGLITNCKNVALVTQYADCTPLLFCDPKKKVIATSHSGWRGTVQEIGKKTVEKMTDTFGCNPKDIIAVIGPCILKCCYEVDAPVFEQFKKLQYLDLNKIFFKKSEDKYMLDLVEANRQILLSAGILPDNIDISDICTCCNSEDLHSHRATNGKRGNLAAMIELK